MDLNANSANEFTPVYAVYEGGTPIRVALFNFVTDLSSLSNYMATISIEDSAQRQVKVKYIRKTRKILNLDLTHLLPDKYK